MFFCVTHLSSMSEFCLVSWRIHLNNLKHCSLSAVCLAEYVHTGTRNSVLIKIWQWIRKSFFIPRIWVCLSTKAKYIFLTNLLLGYQTISFQFSHGRSIHQDNCTTISEHNFVMSSQIEFIYPAFIYYLDGRLTNCWHTNFIKTYVHVTACNFSAGLYFQRVIEFYL